jgi:hypothetical protein
MNRSIPWRACCAIALCLASPATAENGVAMRPFAPALKAESLTGKERLGRKWSDEQRIDNCKVPPDKRGTKPRPILCSDHLTN